MGFELEKRFHCIKIENLLLLLFVFLYLHQ